MLAASPIPQALINKQLQMRAQNHLDEARVYKEMHHFEMALVLYGQAKVAFKYVANKEGVLQLSEARVALTRASTPQTAGEEALRQSIIDIYRERAEVLEKLDKHDKAKASLKKAEAWSYKKILAASNVHAALPASPAIVAASPSVASPVRASSPSPSRPAEPQLHEHHHWVRDVFETILKQFQDLDLCQASPSLFLVYAHNNHRFGTADAGVSQKFIKWLSDLRSNLYSDRTASGHQTLPLPATPKDEAKANDILSSQLCLLPGHTGSVARVILCGSEVLGRYMASSCYQGYSTDIKNAYKKVGSTSDIETIEGALREVVNKHLKEPDFHHVLTELVFLQIRFECTKEEHGVIPILLNNTAEKCFPASIHKSTRIRIEDPIWCEPKIWEGRQTYKDEGAYVGFFKLLKRLFVKQEPCIGKMENEIYQACMKKLREDHSRTLTKQTFSLFLHQTCVTALKALEKDSASNLRELSLQKAYESIYERIAEIIKHINGEALVEPATIRLALEASYSSKSLSIQRLSGQSLPIERCYINLAIVEHEKGSQKEEKSQKQDEKNPEAKEASPNHFHRRQNFETINSNPQKLVPLEMLFEPRKLSNGKNVIPKRILILGGAGAGKTTLSKKIVYEYTQKAQWSDRFDYLLWIPLRTLKGKKSCDLATLFHKIYFYPYPNGQTLAKALAAQIDGPAKNRTLFVLDGWDEVAQEWGEHTPMAGFLKQLLNQPAVVITSRPYVDLRQAGPIDLELETVGFSQENVTAYLDNQDIMPSLQAEEMKRLIEANTFIRELVNVPVQLDALCYSWDEIKRLQKEAPGAMTVTALYQIMMNKLWRKDMLRLGKWEGGEPLTASHINALSPFRLEKLVQAEQDFLSTLAFQGLQRNQIEFHQHDLSKLVKQLARKGVNLPFTWEANFKKLSFLHTDDAEESHRSYQFRHLTFQEFFAAKFLAKHFQAYLSEKGEYKTPAEVTEKGLVLGQEELRQFVNEHKYNPRYQIVWWMVAGLLENEATLEGFFNLLEKPPRDLIGKAHLDLIMYCLHEARARLTESTIERLEKELEEAFEIEVWIDGEGFYNEMLGRSSLARSPAYPEHLLLAFCKKYPIYKKGIVGVWETRLTVSDEIFQFLTEILKAIGNAYADTDYAFNIAKILSKYTSAQTILTFLRKWFAQERHFWKSREIIAAFAPLVATDKSIRTFFEKLFEQEQDQYYSGSGIPGREAIVEAFAPLVATDKSIRILLEKWFEQEQEPWAKKEIVKAFAPLVATEDSILILLQKWFQQKQGFECREEIVKAFIPLIAKNKSVRTLLEKWSEEEQKQFVSLELIRVLIPLVDADELIRNLLKKWVVSEAVDSRDKAEIVEAFVPWVATDESIRTSVRKWFAQERNPVFKIRITKILLSPAATNKLICNLLKEWVEWDLKQEENYLIRAKIASVLTPLVATDDSIRNLLQNWFEEEPDYQIKAEIVQALAPLSITNGQIFSLLQQWYAQHSQLKGAIIWALAPLMPKNEAIGTPLKNWFKQEPDYQIKAEIAQALAPLSITNEQIFSLLQQWYAQHSQLKGAIIWALAPLMPKNEAIGTLLKNWFEKERDYQVKASIALALAPLAATDSSILIFLQEWCEQGHAARIEISTVKISTVLALASLMPKNESIGTLLKKWFELNDFYESEAEKVERLVSLAATDGSILTVLKKWFEQERNYWRKEKIAQLLVRLVATDDSILTLLKKWFEQAQDLEEKSKVISVIAPLVFANEPIENRSNKRLAQSQGLDGITNMVETSSHYLMTPSGVLEEIGHLLRTGEANTAHRIFDQFPHQAYSILPYLSPDELQRFYKDYLFDKKDITNLYYHDEALHFYTPTGPGKPIPISNEQFQTIFRAFEGVREETLADFLSETHLDEEDREDEFLPATSERSSDNEDMESESSLIIENMDSNKRLPPLGAVFPDLFPRKRIKK